ncbi:MAG TPA: cupredoxin domain-containing protein [Solirubrobacteraceae bacterium]
MVILALVPIVLAAALGPTWLALVVLVVVLGGVAARATQLRMRRLRSPDLLVKMAPPHLGPAAERRVLVVANDTLSEEALLWEIERLGSTPRIHVLLLVPAVITPAARLTGAIDSRLDQARLRMQAALDRAGHDNVAGKVTGEDPLEAIDDTFATFVPDEVIVATRWEQTAGGLEPRLAGLVRERFAVPVRHLVFEPGSAGQEPDAGTEARYQREFGAAAARRFGLRALAGAGILAALVLSLVALARTTPTNTTALAEQVAAAPATAAPSAQASVIGLKVIASGKKGPDGKLHDDFTVTEFHVTVGQPLTLRIDNTDTVPHSITSPEAGVSIVLAPGTHDYTLLVKQAGKFEWHCVFPCDPWSMAHVGYMRGFITATAA